jgi:hypothetical protein
MAAKHLFGLLGMLLGLFVPTMSLLLAAPPIGRDAAGGREPLGLFSLESFRMHETWEPSSGMPQLADFSCPVGVWGPYRRLVDSPVPERIRIVPGGSVACVLAGPNGRVMDVLLRDLEGHALSDPDLTHLILSAWSFEAASDPSAEPAWQRIRLDGLLADKSLI